MSWIEAKRERDAALVQALHGIGEVVVTTSHPRHALTHPPKPHDPRPSGPECAAEDDGPDEPGWGPSYAIDASLIFGDIPGDER
jgi:hypothetical protein